MVDLEKQNNIIRKLVFRLVKKHIAGSTSTSVLNVVRDLNKKGFPATVTLLNDHVDDQTKAKYNANAYSQFIKQLSRLNLNSGVSVRLSQIGYGIDDAAFKKNIEYVVDTANSCKHRLWIESEAQVGNGNAMRLYRQLKPKCTTLGVEIRPLSQQDSEIDKIGKSVLKNDIIKLTTPTRDASRKPVKIDRLKLYKEYIDMMVARRVDLTVLEPDEKTISKIVSANRDYRRNLTFEIPLGYSGKSMNALQKSKLNLSVYVPYGKDWIPYFINRLAEGRVRNIAVALLNGEKSTVGLNVKNEGAKAA